jgi:hypothetical protein
MARTIEIEARALWTGVCLVALLGAAGCGGIKTDCGGPNQPPCAIPAPTQTGTGCNVTRSDCVAIDPNTGLCSQHSPPVTMPGAIQCYGSEGAQTACNRLCDATLQMMPGGFSTCMSTPDPHVTVPPTFCEATQSTSSPLEYDAVTCTKTGRVCTFFDEAANCLSEGDLTTITVSDPCIDARTESAYRFCAGATKPDGTALDRSFVKITSYTKNVACPSRSAPVPPLDRSFGLATGTSISATVAGGATTFTTKGGRAVVTYACNNGNCTAQYLKEFELDLNPATVFGYSFTNIKLVSSGHIPINSNNTLSTSGPGFDLSALFSGYLVKNHINPSSTIQLTGSYTSPNFGISTSVNLDVGIIGLFLPVSGTVNVSGTPGGVQINCGDNGAIAPFIADTDFSGGAGKTRTNVIDLTKVTNPAPMTVYQSQHYASPYTYTIPGFAAGSSHLIRLHFAETNPANNAPNRRKFSVAINGTTQISNLDLFATVGMNTAYIKEFTLPANSSGQYVLSFTASLDSATISAIEVL